MSLSKPSYLNQVSKASSFIAPYHSINLYDVEDQKHLPLTGNLSVDSRQGDVEYVGDVTFRGTTYQNVILHDYPAILYYNVMGVLQFSLEDGETWMLDRAE